MKFLDDDIVISGVGAHLPKANNIGELKTRLLNNESLLETVFKKRPGSNICTEAGVIDGKYFDNNFFGIYREQAHYMNPLHRLALERTYEALTDAGLHINDVKGKNIDCVTACCAVECDHRSWWSVPKGYGITGYSPAMLANRISYWLNIHGSSVTYDSSWISGLDLLKLAYDKLKSNEECEGVIVTTASIVLYERVQALYTDMNLLSPDGCTRAFDANANGYGRSAGVITLYIQRARDAKRSYGSIVNVDTVYDGDRKNSYLDINVNSMSKFLTNFYKKCDVDPKEVDFVEAYGCGIPAMDEKELEALEKIYCKNRKTPLLVGSVKSNAGHGESSAALFSVLKALIILETGIIPADINFEKPNPKISSLVEGTIKVVDRNLQFNSDYVAVNAIGLSSSYGHLLLKRTSKPPVEVKGEKIPRLALISTRTEAGIQEILDKVGQRNEEEYFQLLQDLFTKPITGHLFRGFSLKGTEETHKEFGHCSDNKRPVWFVYSGMGSQWTGMCSDLMKIPVFAETIKECHNILKPKGLDLINIITTDDKTIFDHIMNSFVGIAAIQIALTNVLTAIDIVPDGIIGHSVGELGCGYADGCLTAGEMILSAYYRGKASIETKLEKGSMAAVGLGYNQIKQMCPPTIDVACHNGPDSSTLSGPTKDMEKFVKELQDKGIFARLVNVGNIAYHSRYIKPAAPKLLQYLKEAIPVPKPRSSKWISTSSSEDKWGTEIAKNSCPEYYTNNLLNSVLFEEGLKHIPKEAILIEIAPHGLLQAILKRSLKPGCLSIALTHRNSKSQTEFLLTSLGKLYVSGLNMSVQNLYPRYPYPVSANTATLADLVSWEHIEEWVTAYSESTEHNNVIKDCVVTLNSEEFHDFIGNRFDDKIIVSYSFLLNMVFDMMVTMGKCNQEIIFEDLCFKKIPCMTQRGDVAIHIMIHKGSGTFEILAENKMVLFGKVSTPDAGEKFLDDKIPVETRSSERLSKNDFYNELEHRGYKFSGNLRALNDIYIGQEGSVSTVEWNNSWPLFLEAMLQQLYLHAGEEFQEICVPLAIQRIAISLSKMPNEKSNIQISYHQAANVMSAEGIQIKGVTIIPYQTEQKTISNFSIEAVPLRNPPNANMEQCINMALQLIIEKAGSKFVNSIFITEIESVNSSLKANIEKIIQEYSNFYYIKLEKINDIDSLTVNQNPNQLIVINDKVNEKLLNIIASSQFFLLCRSSNSILSNSEVIEVAQQTINGVVYSIIKKAHTHQPYVVRVDTTPVTLLDNSTSNEWMTNLEATLEKALVKEKKVHLIIPAIPLEGVTNFINELRQKRNHETISIDFVLNKQDFVNTSDVYYQQLFKADLPTTVKRSGMSGAYITTPLSIKQDIKNTVDVSKSALKNFTLSCLGFNLKDETPIQVQSNDKRNELGNMDYSGITNSGQRVMGLARYDPNNSKLIPDDILKWTIPTTWSDAEGASVPNAYSSAYYALIIKGELQPNTAVLIHTGCTAIGLAAISIALAHGCRVFTTVATDLQRSYIKKHTNLKDRDIFSSKTDQFQPLIMSATRGEGVKVVLNCLSGYLLNASVSCLSLYGRFIHIGRYDLQGQCSINMSVFLKNTMFCVVNLNEMFTLEKETKEQIRDLVQEGIKSFAVIPLHYNIVDTYEVDSIVNILGKPGHIGKVVIEADNVELNQINPKNPTTFVCQEDSSYIVCGGDLVTCPDLVEWLIKRGAKKVLLLSDINTEQPHIRRRFGLLEKNFNARIKISTHKMHTKEEAVKVISEASCLGSIHAVFLLESKLVDVKMAQNIDAATRATAPDAFLVNLQANVAGFCQEKAEAGYPVYNLHGPELSFSNKLCALDEVLNTNCKDILARKNQAEDSDQDSIQSLIHRLNLMLPSSLEEYSSHTVPEKPNFHQLATQAQLEIRNVLPLFIIPGISGRDEIIKLSKQLIYPAYVAELPSSTMPIAEMAKELVTQMIKIWGKSPYNILAVSWGGALALEMAKILNQKSCKVHFYCIDAAPSSLQASLKHFGENLPELETNILKKFLEINDSKVFSELSKESSWAEKLKRVESYCHSEADKRAMDALRSRLVELYNYQVPDYPILYNMHLIRPTGSSKYDDCGLKALCKGTLVGRNVNGDHISILSQTDTAKYINKSYSQL